MLGSPHRTPRVDLGRVLHAFPRSICVPLHKGGAISGRWSRGPKPSIRRLCSSHWADQNKLRDAAWVKTTASVALGIFLLWGGASSYASNVAMEGGMVLERQKLENVILDEISSRVQRMPDDELLGVLEDLLRSPAQGSRPNKRSNNTSPPQNGSPKGDLLSSLSEKPITNSQLNSENMLQDEIPPGRRSMSPEVPKFVEQQVPALEEGSLSDQASRPANAADEMSEEIDGFGLKPGLSVGDILEQIRESALVVPDEVVYSPQEQFLVNALERFGFEPTRMLRVIKAAGAGGVFIVTVLWGPQLVRGLFLSTADPSDSLAPKAPLNESTQALREPGQTAPASSSQNLATPEVMEDQGPGKKDPKGSWFSFLPVNWGLDKDPSKENLAKGVIAEGTSRPQEAIGPKGTESPEPAVLPEMGSDAPVKSGVLWRREDNEWMDFQGEDQEEGRVLWRRDEASSSTSTNGEEQFFVVEGDPSSQESELDDPGAPPSGAKEWTPTIWDDPWLDSTSGAGKEAEQAVDREIPQAFTFESKEPSDGDVGAAEAGADDIAKVAGASRDAGIDGNDLLNNVDDRQTTVAARIAISKRRPRQI